jgi:hypothetical protein
MTVRDFLKQRRRIHAGHLKVRSLEHYTASTMKAGSILQELIAYAPFVISSPRQALWTFGTIAMEGLARVQGHYDVLRKRSHHVWQAVASTKALEDEQRKLRRICSTQSVIVFHLSLQRNGENNLQREREERLIMQTMRKFLPLQRSYIRKDDLLSLHGANTLVAVLNAERNGVELIATRLKQMIEAQDLLLSKQRHARLLVNFHGVSFAQE